LPTQQDTADSDAANSELQALFAESAQLDEEAGVYKTTSKNNLAHIAKAEKKIKAGKHTPADNLKGKRVEFLGSHTAKGDLSAAVQGQSKAQRVAAARKQTAIDERIRGRKLKAADRAAAAKLKVAPVEPAHDQNAVQHVTPTQSAKVIRHELKMLRKAERKEAKRLGLVGGAGSIPQRHSNGKYFYNGKYYKYYHDGQYYNYKHNGQYYTTFRNGQYFNGLYNLKTMPANTDPAVLAAVKILTDQSVPLQPVLTLAQQQTRDAKLAAKKLQKKALGQVSVDSFEKWSKTLASNAPGTVDDELQLTAAVFPDVHGLQAKILDGKVQADSHTNELMSNVKAAAEKFRTTLYQMNGDKKSLAAEIVAKNKWQNWHDSIIAQNAVEKVKKQSDVVKQVLTKKVETVNKELSKDETQIKALKIAMQQKQNNMVKAVKNEDAKITNLRTQIYILRNNMRQQTNAAVKAIVAQVGRAHANTVKSMRAQLKALRQSYSAQLKQLKKQVAARRAELNKKISTMSKELKESKKKEAATKAALAKAKRDAELLAAKKELTLKQRALLRARKAAALRLARAKALSRQEQKLREQQDAIEAAKAKRMLTKVQAAAALAKLHAQQREREIVRATKDQLSQVATTIAEGKINQEAAQSALDLQADIVRARLNRRTAEVIKTLESDYLRVDASLDQTESIKRDLAAASAVARYAKRAKGARLIAMEAEQHAEHAAREMEQAEQEVQNQTAESESAEEDEEEDD
jgi:hypothetical protein